MTDATGALPADETAGLLRRRRVLARILDGGIVVVPALLRIHSPARHLRRHPQERVLGDADQLDRSPRANFL